MKFLRHPKQLFSAYLPEGAPTREASREDQFGKVIVWFAERGPLAEKQPSEQELRWLHYFPGATRFIGPKAVHHPRLLNAIKQDPTTALLYLIYHYPKAASELEPTILADGASVACLLDWAEAKKVSLAQPREVYLAALARDPFWALQFQRKAKDPLLARLLVEYVRLHHETAAGAAYVHVMSDEVKNAARYIPILAQDPLYACLATKLKGRLKGIRISSDDIGRRLTPQWAYFFLTYGNAEDAPAFEKIVANDPAWWVEYAMFKGWMKEAKGAAQFDVLFRAWMAQNHPYCQIAKEFMVDWSKQILPRRAA